MTWSSLARHVTLDVAAAALAACSAGSPRSTALDGGEGAFDLAAAVDGGEGAIDMALAPDGGAPVPSVGATTPFVSYEAEAGTLGGGATMVALTSPPTTQFSSPALESSGHAYVHLSAVGQYVEWTNNT